MKRLFLLYCFIIFAFSSKAYWQQHTATTINVTLDDKNHFLYGYERIVYTNNSPDTLRSIFIHLHPNAYKNDRTFFAEQQVEAGKTNFYYSPEKDKGYIDSLRFKINDETVDFNYYQQNIDVATIDLLNPLLPGDSIIIETPFRVKIPTVFSRLGHTEQAYFISQWFPKPAVYDTQGWHPLPYTDQGEFYSEFGSYDVSITLPKNYIVMATGNLQNASEVAWIDSLSKIDFPKDTLYKKSYPISDEEFKTIRYTENNVHDFAWFADKRWIVRKDTIAGENNIGITEAFAAFLPKYQNQWVNATTILKQTINSYGSQVGAYPYRTIKAVEGDMKAGGGMEYPTITVIDKAAVSMLKRVIVHEAGHNWFYGILGSNERVNPWMDEGLNTFYEQKTMQKIATKKTNDVGAEFENELVYHFLSINKDQPSTAIATDFNSLNYGADVYYKTALLMNLLALDMGNEFEPAMKAYYNTWKFKHPQPADFRKAMEDNCTKNLDWFFDKTINTDKKIDLKIKSVKRRNDSVVVVLSNKSDYKIPTIIGLYHKDSLLKTYTVEPFNNDYAVNFGVIKKWDKAKIGAAWFDFKLTNNIYNRKALLPKFGLRLRPIAGLNQSFKNDIFLSPALSYNEYDKVGAGILIHNLTLPQNRFQFAVAPMYSFGSKRVNGVGALSYSWYPSRVFQEVRLQGNVKTFSQNSNKLNIPETLYARYFKLAPSVEFIFKEASLKSKKQHSLLLKQYNISEDYFSYAQDLSVDSLYRPSIQNQQNTYALLRYQFSHKQTFHPYSFNAEVQLGNGFVKMGLETKKRIDYDIANKSFYIRGYAGKFIVTNNSPSTANSRYYLNTTFSNANDYLYDDIYFGRNKNINEGSTQIAMREGGFKIPTNLYANPIGRSDDWLFALNLKTDLPFGKIPLRFYADFATFANAKNINPSAQALLFNAGLEFNLFGDALSLYIPLLSSSDFSDYLKSMYPKNRILNSISFSINIQNFNFLRSNQAVIDKLSE